MKNLPEFLNLYTILAFIAGVLLTLLWTKILCPTATKYIPGFLPKEITIA